MRKEQQSLIKGVFTPGDAKEILWALFNSKIQFHRDAAFSIEERTGQPALGHLQRAEELRNALRSLMDYVNAAAALDTTLSMECTVLVSAGKEPAQAADV